MGGPLGGHLSIWLYWGCAAILVAVWLAYPILLRGLEFATCFRGQKVVGESDQALFGVSILIAAHNEEIRIVSRINNIYACDYPEDLIEVVVVSDGSDDDTVRQVREHVEKHGGKIKVIDLKPQRGRAHAHNVGMSKCSERIVVFTDADTEFERNFLRKIVAPFQDRAVGYASGMLKYRNRDSSDIAQSAGLYWRFEYLLRRLETRLGVYVFGSGACCAVRKELFRDIPASGDVDFTTPLDVVLQGYKCVHVDDAVAYDEMPDNPKREFRARVRMTAKNFHGMITRWGVRGLVQHPIYSLAIFFHKIGRWLTPFAMIVVFISNFFLLQDGVLYQVAVGIQVLFYLLAVLGLMKVPVPLAAQVYSFCLANAGFMVGVLKALAGRVPAAYTPVNKI
ncbi:MAG: glycosyltransferase [Gammaproteobacteria bacterium]|nr:MAG: glycosyltransferase [Gammaproteobacteria bacterium]